MKRLGLFAAVAAVWLIAGCAAAPQAEDARAAFDAGQESADSDAAPNLVVDAQDVHPGSEVKCREMLKPGSNVIVKQCMTQDAWKRYERAEAARAQAFVRALQGSPYQGIGW